MKLVAVDAARANLASLIAQAQAEPVCLTRHGRPVALLTGIEGQDIDKVVERARLAKGNKMRPVR